MSVITANEGRLRPLMPIMTRTARRTETTVSMTDTLNHFGDFDSQRGLGRHVTLRARGKRKDNSGA
jgi:hypothetical protein